MNWTGATGEYELQGLSPGTPCKGLFSALNGSYGVGQTWYNDQLYWTDGGTVTANLGGTTGIDTVLHRSAANLGGPCGQWTWRTRGERWSWLRGSPTNPGADPWVSRAACGACASNPRSRPGVPSGRRPRCRGISCTRPRRWSPLGRRSPGPRHWGSPGG